MALNPECSRQPWLEACILSMNPTRFKLFQDMSNRELRCGSDCSGAEAAFHAIKHWAPRSSNKMMSEDPAAHAPILFSLLNSPPDNFFMDMLARGYSGYCIMKGEATKVPMRLDLYSAGTVCIDFSNLNQLNPKEFVGAHSIVFDVICLLSKSIITAPQI